MALSGTYTERVQFRWPPASAWMLRFLPLVVLIAIWEWSAHTSPSLLIPACTETLQALVRLLESSQFWEAFWITNQAMVAGFVLAAAAGVPLGLLMGRWNILEDAAGPYLSILLVTPMAAVIPILIMALGLGMAARIAVIFLFAFASIVVTTRAGLRMTDPAWVEMARAFGASELQLWRNVFLRASRPAILMGLRLGLMRSISGMVAMELLLTATGLGRMILDFQNTFDAGSMYATVIAIAGEAILLTILTSRLESTASPYLDQAAGE
jgi:NitT/TauT family transport system permease protein